MSLHTHILVSWILTRFQEAKEGVLQLHDDDPDALESMLRYIYTSKYPEVPSNEWEKHLGLAVIADKYCLQLLKESALEKLEGVKPFYENVRSAPYKPTLIRFEPSLEFVVRVGNALLNGSDQFEKIVNKHCGHDFQAFFKKQKFRKMLDRHTEVRDWLYVEHIQSLAALPEFKALIQSNDQLAAKYLQEVVKTYLD